MTQPEAHTTTLRWWTRPVRVLWLALRFFWGTIILGVLIGIISAVLFLPRGTDPHTLITGVIVDWVGQHWVISLVVSLLFVALTALTWLVIRRFDDAPAPHMTSILSNLSQHRAKLVRSLRQEYARRLTQSLQGAAMMVLGLQERTNVTRSSAQFVFYRSEATGAQPLPPCTSIAQAYDEAMQGLLILGEPGAGKTTLILDLAGELLRRAEGDQTHPIPVILNLSSWVNKKLPLGTWLIEQLRLVYSVPSRYSQAWLEQEQWLLLLDGLDEVEESARGACIEAINSYRGAYFVPLVVCSRSREYLTQKAQLVLPSAVEVQPLQEQQVIDYLEGVGKPMEAVSAEICSNPTLRQLITTPLMLSVVILAYRDKAVKDLPQGGSTEEQQQQIFEYYVQRMLERRTTRGYFAPQRTREWLTWLAQHMKQYSISEFYLERLQPTWLSTKQSKAIYKLLIGLVLGFPLWLFIALFWGPLVGLLVGTLVGLLHGLSKDQEIRPTEVLIWSPKKFRQTLRSWLVLELVIGLVGGLGLGVFIGLQGRQFIGLVLGFPLWLFIGLVFGFVVGLLGGLVFGFVVGLVSALSGAQITENLRAKPNQEIRSSGWNALRIGLISALLGGLLARLLVGLPYNLAYELNVWWPAWGLLAGLIGGLSFGGAAYLQHYLLRFLLWRSAVIPWHYVRFLEEATERILLQRVGGGYRFIHPLFLDYFDAHGTESPLSPDPQSTLKQT